MKVIDFLSAIEADCVVTLKSRSGMTLTAKASSLIESEEIGDFIIDMIFGDMDSITIYVK